MSRGKCNRAQQTQKLNLSKQGSTASKGVNYCTKCERRRNRKEKKVLTPVIENPPLSLILLWLSICFGFYKPQSVNFTALWINYLSMTAISFCILIDVLALLKSWYRRLTRPILTPQMGFTQMDPFLKEAIQVWCLFESLRDAKTKRGMIAAIIQYMQAHVKDSLPTYLYRQIMRIDYISDWTSEDGHSQVEAMLDEAFGPGAVREIENELAILDTQDGNVVEMS